MTSSLRHDGAEKEEARPILPCGSCCMRMHGICGSVSGADLARLAPLATLLDLARGQIFVDEDGPATHFFIVVVGSAKLYKIHSDGRRQIVGFAYRGDLLGLAADAGYAFSAEAITPLRVCRISQARLRHTLRDCREIERRLLEIAVDDLVRAHEQMLLLGRKSAIEKAASFVLLQASKPQPGGVRPPRIHLPMSRADIADYLGTTLETISRSLARLRERGAISMPNVHEIEILDRPRLAAIAGGAPAPLGRATGLMPHVLPDVSGRDSGMQGPTERAIVMRREIHEHLILIKEGAAPAG